MSGSRLPRARVAAYNWDMARGWESKSVESQIEMAETRRIQRASTPQKSTDLALIRKREGLQLSRTRIVREMESSHNPRYKSVLSKALAELDAQIAAIAVD